MSKDDEFLRQLDELGEAEVEIRIAQRVYGNRRKALAEQWLANQERSRNESSQAEQIEIARSAKDAAWEAARAARDANQHAKTANIIAAIALIAALISIAVTIFRPLLFGGA